MSGPLEKQRGDSAYIQKRERAEREKRERQKHQDNIEIVGALDRLRNQLATDEQEEARDHGKKAFRDWATILLIFATVVTAGIGDVIFYKTMRDARIAATGAHSDNVAATAQAAKANADTSRGAEQTRVESSRAWVGPTTATIDAAPTLGKPATVSISYQNTGKEPARNFTYYASPAVINLAADHAGKLTQQYSDYMGKCLRTPDTENAGVVYPSTGFNGNTLTVTVKGAAIDSNVIAGKNGLLVQGCFVYRTFNQPHHSAFCASRARSWATS
jgi:hypothetical protein